MVVVAIIGVILLVVHVRAPDRAADVLGAEARQVIATIEDCRDRAVLSGTPHGIGIGGNGYWLLHYRRGWKPLADDADAGDEGASRHRLPIDVDLVATLALRASAQAVVVCLPTGDVELPRLELVHHLRPGRYRIRDDGDTGFVAEWLEPAR